MRLTECLQRRVKDLDFAYLQITIRGGKGKNRKLLHLALPTCEVTRRVLY